MIVIKRILKPENDFWLASVIFISPLVIGLLIYPISPIAAVAVILFGYFIVAMFLSVMIGVVITLKRMKNHAEDTNQL